MRSTIVRASTSFAPRAKKDFVIPKIIVNLLPKGFSDSFAYIIYNYVNINSPPEAPPVYIDILTGDGTGGGRGGSYSAPSDPGTVSMSISREGMASIGANFA